MRLIDADKCPCILCKDTRNAHCTYEHRSCEKFCNWLNNTAYDVDNVVEKLEQEKEIAEKEMEECIFKALPYHDSTEGKVIGIKKAIDIVQKGGIK